MMHFCIYLDEEIIVSKPYRVVKELSGTEVNLDWLQSLNQFFIDVSYHILVARLTLMALFHIIYL